MTPEARLFEAMTASHKRDLFFAIPTVGIHDMVTTAFKPDARFICGNDG